MLKTKFASSVSVLAAFACVSFAATVPAAADDLPAIKVSSANQVPACVTPGRLQAYLKSRNPSLDPRFETIAVDYMRHGEALGVRWEYAFFQMIMETGQLSFRNGNRAGDVKPSQNNFAGLGATGGVPGESFPDVSTGVRAHLEHVLLYAGEKVESPVAERTRKVQEWGVLTDWHKGIKHPITYSELASKWAPKSRGYIDGIEQIAAKFFDDACKKPDPNPEYVAAARNQPAHPGQPATQVAAVQPATVVGVVHAAPAALPAATAFDQQPDKVSGAALARKAVDDEPAVRSGLGAGNVPRVNILNAPPVVEERPAVNPETAAQVKAAITSRPPATPHVTKTAAVGALPKAAATPEATPPQATPQPAPQAAPAAVIAPANVPKCRVWTASYGGQRAVIVKAIVDHVANFTVLDVNEGQEAREAEAFISAYAKGGAVAGEFANQNKALEKAFELCPEG